MITKVRTKEYYNASRILATLEDQWTGKIYEREINFPTFPFTTQERADEFTTHNIQDWIITRGNKQHETALKLIGWKRLPW